MGVTQRMLADQVSLPSYQGSSVVELCGTHDTKAWFNSSQPMTRSRSSELRRKYVTMQNSQTLIGLQGAMDADMEGFVVPANLVQMNVGSREGSQSQSSAAAPVFSTGLDVSNRQNNSGQSQSVCGSHKKLVANGKCRENRSVTKGDRGDPTKKRRVERSKK
ncbi:CYCLOPS-like protein isoform X2 [Tanacetum coccineum]